MPHGKSLLLLFLKMTNMADLRPIGPRFVNTHRLSKTLPGSQNLYKRFVPEFLSVITKFRFRFDNFMELDVLLVEYEYMESPT